MKSGKASPFMRACCMFEINDDGKPQHVRTEPAEFDFGGDFEIVMNNAFPVNRDETCVFAFSITDYFCYVYFRTYEGREYSYVIVSDHPTPLFYFEFFEDLDSVLKSGVVLIPDALMTVIISIVSDWKILDNCIMSIVYLSKRQRFPIDSFPVINPFKYMKCEYNFVALWQCLLSGGRILIKGNPKDPNALSKAFFGVISLSRVIRYREKVLLMPNPSDNRIQSDFSEYKVIATTSKTLPPDKFDIVMRILDRTHLSNNHLNRDIVRRNDQIKVFLSYLIQRQMAYDPYNELLHKPLITDDLRTDFNVFLLRHTISFRQLKGFSSLKSLDIWRDENIVTNGFRDGFLSHSPADAVAKQNDADLQLCLKRLDEISPKFANDFHMTQVIKAHKRLIRARLHT